MILCRLCSGNAYCKFNLKVLGRFDVGYYECKNCRSLLTEEPYWLDLAYDHNITASDIGIVQRNIENLIFIFFLAKILKTKNIIDFGGGDGLLCRMLRDYELNCYLEDKFSRPTYAQNFIVPNFLTPDLICGFEVIEHLVCPPNDLKKIFNKKAKYLVFSTVVYLGHNEDWWYLSKHTGQHIFFYSKEALFQLGTQFNYKCYIARNYVIYSQNSLNLIQKFLIKMQLNKFIYRLLKISLLLKNPKGIANDYQNILK